MVQIVDHHIQSDLQDSIRSLLEDAVAIDEGDKCTLQVFDERSQTLCIIAQKGFSNKFLSHFEVVRPFDGSACGRAIGIGSPVIINDFSQEIALEAHRNIARDEGIGAVVSVPVLGPHEEKLGVFSIHYIDSKWTWNLTNILEASKKLIPILSSIKRNVHFEVRV